VVSFPGRTICLHREAHEAYIYGRSAMGLLILTPRLTFVYFFTMQLPSIPFCFLR